MPDTNKLLHWFDKAIECACRIGRDDEFKAIESKLIRHSFRAGEVTHIKVGKTWII